MSSPRDVDVDEAPQAAVASDDALAQLAVLRVERLEHLADRAAGGLRPRRAAGRGAQLGRDLDRDRHQTAAPANAASNASTRRLDLGDLERAAHGVDRLQAVAGDAEHDALVGVDVAALGELGQHRGGDAAGGLGEDAGRLGEQADAGADLVVGHRVDAAAGRRASSTAYGPSAGLPIASDLAIVSGLTGRQTSRAGGERLGDRRAALGLGAVHVRHLALEQPAVDPLLEAARDLREQRAGGDRRDDAVRAAPSRAARRSRRRASSSPRRSTGAC